MKQFNEITMSDRQLNNGVVRRDKANAIRALSMDAVQKAKSGHPGAPMGMADIAEVLWCDYLKHNPNNPEWVNRDRFVLSNGHGSMLIYALLHLTGYAVDIDDLKQFRQLHSKTPGHPEYGYAPGVETTTGPLGQGISNAVGMAIAEKVLAAQFNRENFSIVDHRTWTFIGDGCLMEGISHEVCSLAGTLGLGKLVAFWDDNGISIDGEVAGWFTDDTPARFRAYGWQVIEDIDGHDAASITAAIEQAVSNTEQPTLICCKTVIGFGSPNKQGKSSSHGAPLGEDEIVLAREKLGWSYPPFEIPDSIYAAYNASKQGDFSEVEWQSLFKGYQAKYSDLADDFLRRMKGELPVCWEETSKQYIATVNESQETIASRKASQNALNGFGPSLPELIGGSADLAGSNLTLWSNSKPLTSADADGNYINYGVREFGMAAIMNGLVLHGGFIPYGATFLMFSEYARNALRMAALMKIGSIFVFTHDSIGLGEDGPTHQAVEQAATLRLMPGMSVWRPCDSVESAVAWKYAIEHRASPTSLLFSRQNLAFQQRSDEQLADISRGGYILRPCSGTPDAIIIATGSEVGLAMSAAEKLDSMGHEVRVVSMPSTDVFDSQDASWKEHVLPRNVRVRLSIEAGVTDGWIKYVGLDGRAFGLDTFGESGPADEVFEYFGFNLDNVVTAVTDLLN